MTSSQSLNGHTSGGPASLAGPSSTGTGDGPFGPEAGFDGSTAVAAADLLAHWWSRPVQDEVATWSEAAGLEVGVRDRAPTSPQLAPLAVSGQELGLLDEYERLFVGPGPVPCPPYESFWREDVPIDIRRSLMGPCTAQLRQLYRDLGIELAADSGELPDHVAVEFEALAFALSSDETSEVARAIWSDHLGHWLPRLCRAVSREAEARFYKDLAQLSLDWGASLQGLLGAPASGGPASSANQAPG
ncbi:MAG TPA: molecular chaperone TorD family protein [Acidimicrobiales bacterium]|nr:molecular chaperone TorD family protein [Acidimicrobiales bacterium]